MRIKAHHYAIYSHPRLVETELFKKSNRLNLSSVHLGLTSPPDCQKPQNPIFLNVLQEINYRTIIKLNFKISFFLENRSFHFHQIHTHSIDIITYYIVYKI